MNNCPEVVHTIHSAASARNFVVPLVEHLIKKGVRAELWIEPGRRHASAVQDVVVPHRFVDIDICLNPVESFRRVLRFRRMLRQCKPRVLHVHQTRAALIPLVAAKLERVPVRLYHNHGLPYLGHRGPVRWLLRTLERINIALSTHVLLVSHSNLLAARNDGLLRETGTVLANGSAAGIDLNVFSSQSFDSAAKSAARLEFGIPEHAFVVAYVGRPVRRKGFHLMLRAWQSSTVCSGSNVLLVAGCSEKDCRAALGRSNPHVKGLGFLADLRGVYASCDVVALPSEHEGFPYSLLEGAAAGRALLGTDIPGICSAIEHGRTGLLVRNRDEPRLRAALEDLQADMQTRSNMGVNARASVERKFSRGLVLSALWSYYIDELRFYAESSDRVNKPI